MKWFFIIVLAILWLNAPAVGLVGTIIFVSYHIFKKSASPEHETIPIQSRQSSTLTAGDLANLVLLRLELQNQLNAGHIDSEQHAELTQHIDALCKQHLAEFSAVPDNVLWQKRRTLAWDLLNHHAETPLGQPPWIIESLESTDELELNVTPTVSTEQTPATAIQEDKPRFVLQEQQPALFAIDEQDHSSTVDWVGDSVIQQPTNTTATFVIDEQDHSVAQLELANPRNPNLNQYAWKPHEPTRLERALTAISGWHSMAVPFLVQNIGWFIGIFCFIAGSTFLVHSTEGYASNLIAFFAFFIFTLALLFGGYQLRSKRPELETSSTVIFILSVLLIPLTTLTATQLLVSSESSGLRIVSSLLILIELGVFYFVVTLVSGLMDRSLQQGLPKFFIALTAACTLQPLLLGVPFWQMLAVIHLLIVAVLSAGIYRYATQWLQSIFIDQRKIAYFAAGTLVYAALVAFISISTRNNISLPDGYIGFFLMVLSGLLFFVDAQFKHWTQQAAQLSRFSFFVYGLSVLALCLVARYQIASMLTLILAIGLYAFIVWRYLTLTPLSIFLACCFWLYSLLVLQHLPESQHLLASLPVLLALHRAANWALNKRQSAYLALIVYRVLYGLLALLTVWSLAHSESGLLAMLTAITASVLTYYALKSAPAALFSPDIKNAESVNNYQNLLNSAWFYTLPALGAVTVFYAPRLPALTNELQFALGLLLLSVCWAYSGLTAFFNAHSTSETKRIEQHLNSALLSIAVGLLPLLILPNPSRIIVLFSAGAITLWLSYKLLSRSLFYVLFILWGAGFALLKATYFPPPSNGIVTVLLGLMLWFWLWSVERKSFVLQRDLAAQKNALLPSCRLFSFYPLPSSTSLFKDVIHAPLEQLMVLSWLLTLKAVLVRWLAELPSYGWLASIFLAGLLGCLLIVRYRLIKLLPVPILLVLTALLLLLQFIGLSSDSLLLFAVLFALAVWQGLVYSLKQPLFIKLLNVLNPLFLQHESESIAKVTHHTAFCVLLGGAILQLITADSAHNLPILLTLLTSAVFLWLSNKTYSDLIVRYLVLGFAVLTAVELVALTVHPLFHWRTLGADNYAGLLLTLVSFPLAALSNRATAYSKPASIVAMLLVFTSIALQSEPVSNITLLDYSVLFLAGFSLLIANVKPSWTFCNFSAFAVLVLAVLRLETSVLHPHQPFSLWLGEQSSTHSWLVLGLLSLVLSLLSHTLEYKPRFVLLKTVYCSPLNTIANLCFGSTLLNTLILFLVSVGHAPLLSWLLLVSLLAMFSVSKNWSNAAHSRGLGSACLLPLIVFSLLPTSLSGFSLQTITMLFGYTLWCCASFVLPRFNKCTTEWVIEPLFFPWLGLLLVLFSNGWWQLITEIEVGFYCLELSVYCLLMLRYSRWAGFAWLAAFAFTAAGVIFNIDNENLPINLLLWGNLQLLLVNVWQRKGEALAHRWQWQCAELAKPFTFTATLIFASYLLVGSVLWVVMLDDHSIQEDTLLIGILLALSFLHVLWLRFSTVVLHGFIYALFLLLWSIYFTYLSRLFQPPLLLALWSTLLLASIYICQQKEYKSCPEFIERARFVLQLWLRISVILATLALLSYTQDTLGELLLSLAIIAGLSAVLAGRATRSIWLIMAKIEGLLFLHGWVFLLVDITHFYALLSWYALQNTLLAVLAIWLLKRVLAKPMNDEDTDYYTQALRGTSWLIALGLVELVWHGLLIQQAVITGKSLNWLFPPFDVLVALSTGLIISVIGVRHVRHLPDSNWLYGIVTLLTALGFYSRLILLGNAPVSLWDTAILIVFAYSLFFSQRLFPSKPLLNMALLMPVLALFTVPLQLASPETSVTLILSSGLYALMRRHTQQKIPLYMALLAFNGGVYLWIPSLVDSSQLIQVYVIPAALSILMLLHLHRRELKPSVLMASRLAAISSIYACATVDVFLRAELGIFILAMVLSVAGILLGIALRTRAFLYAGVSFLLLNVLGQLFRFYPEQGFGKAIVLMVMGAIITGSMIWFNIKRVEILQRVSAIQAEMQDWE